MLGVGEDPDRAGAADLEGLGVAEVVEVAGDPGEGLVEEPRVGGVQGHHHIGGGRCTGAVAQPDTAPGEGLLLLGETTVGVEVQPGLLDQPGGLDLTDPGGGGGDQPVREQRGLDAQVGGLPGDQPGPPHRHRTGDHPVPQPGEPAGQLEGVGDQLPAGVLADPQCGGQVGGGELRDPRGTRTGQRDQALAVQVGLTPVRRCLLGRAGMQPRPHQRHLQLLAPLQPVARARAERTRSITSVGVRVGAVAMDPF